MIKHQLVGLSYASDFISEIKKYDQLPSCVVPPTINDMPLAPLTGRQVHNTLGMADMKLEEDILIRIVFIGCEQVSSMMNKKFGSWVESDSGHMVVGIAIGGCMFVWTPASLIILESVLECNYIYDVVVGRFTKSDEVVDLIKGEVALLAKDWNETKIYGACTTSADFLIDVMNIFRLMGQELSVPVSVQKIFITIRFYGQAELVFVVPPLIMDKHGSKWCDMNGIVNGMIKLHYQDQVRRLYMEIITEFDRVILSGSCQEFLSILLSFDYYTRSQYPYEREHCIQSNRPCPFRRIDPRITIWSPNPKKSTPKTKLSYQLGDQ